MTDEDKAEVQLLIGQAILEERRKVKAYIDAVNDQLKGAISVADAVRLEDAVEAAEKELLCQ